ncbi:uncharacterized protein MYCFIDRAFT_179529 [Pseudocercospora fijiensis CIRAD86]|uniref:Uncharacterized protein n=1 Tax=Pseudocercospora fijiensis (strain CIRAD86) TaxID=383855 RepID=M2ZG17_PSEFD|nr:uncharacterized protein MYCFIDRAFT_179529 [Pseudocercospora fijiensis CIRAD86]EME78089.1 hypothetical protein MYCFIDRAFT_179529 [Pseudocercospora fijiensis CIRAD86]
MEREIIEEHGIEDFYVLLSLCVGLGIVLGIVLVWDFCARFGGLMNGHGMELWRLRSGITMPVDLLWFERFLLDTLLVMSRSVFLEIQAHHGPSLLRIVRLLRSAPKTEDEDQDVELVEGVMACIHIWISVKLRQVSVVSGTVESDFISTNTMMLFFCMLCNNSVTPRLVASKSFEISPFQFPILVLSEPQVAEFWVLAELAHRKGTFWGMLNKAGNTEKFADLLA